MGGASLSHISSFRVTLFSFVMRNRRSNLYFLYVFRRNC